MEKNTQAVQKDFLQATRALTQAFEAIPDEHLHWTPSATTRTPVQIAAHAALSILGIRDYILGKPLPSSDHAELYKCFRKLEDEYTTRQQVNELLKNSIAEYSAWLETLTPEDLGRPIEGTMSTEPLSEWITFPATHIRYHTGQLEYIQSVHGDLNMYR